MSRAMAPERIVYVVDDDPAIRRSLERLLATADFRVVSYATPMEFLEAAAGLPAGCVVLDLRMPEMNGLDVQARLLTMRPDLPIIVVTGQGDVHSAVRAMKAGAVDFIEKPYSDDSLIVSIESAVAGSGRSAQTDERAAAEALFQTLSQRERQVLEALMVGHSNKVIAYDLDISVRTVEVHRARMMDRLGVRQLAEAVRLAVLAKLTPES
jgi:two-component system, LuxR family, response regulator FixJ